MIFVLDNYDSFTYNLVQYMGELGAEMVIRRNDELTPVRSGGASSRPDPDLAGAMHAAGCGDQHRPYPALRAAGRTATRADPRRVCLGHQAIGAAFGGSVVRAPKLMHGKTSEVEHDGRTIFAGIPSAMTCTRYHSLIVEDEGLPEVLEVSARAGGKR